MFSWLNQLNPHGSTPAVLGEVQQGLLFGAVGARFRLLHGVLHALTHLYGDERKNNGSWWKPKKWLKTHYVYGCFWKTVGFLDVFWGVGASGRLVFGDTQGSRTTKRLHWKLLLQISHQGLQVEAKLSKSWAISNASHRKTKKMEFLKKEEQTKLQTVLGPGYFGATFPSGPCHSMPNNDLPPDPRWALHGDLTKLLGV